MWPCKSSVTTIGISGPTRCRTRSSTRPSASSSLTVTIAPCSSSKMPSIFGPASSPANSRSRKMSTISSSQRPIGAALVLTVSTSSIPRASASDIKPAIPVLVPCRFLRSCSPSLQQPGSWKSATVVGLEEKVLVSCARPPTSSLIAPFAPCSLLFASGGLPHCPWPGFRASCRPVAAAAPAAAAAAAHPVDLSRSEVFSGSTVILIAQDLNCRFGGSLDFCNYA